MSDEFDKEAEREKLREKLEKDEEKRQETQRMSELLLQGATMTNEHCENCGDPLFRDGDETFCPTCGGERATEQPTEQAPQQSSGQPQQQPAEQQPAEQQAPQPSDAEPARSESERGTGAPTPDRFDVSRPDPASGAPPAADDPRAELRRAVTTTARKANEASDPRTAKEWLEASKEAAEALEALGE
ncbi:MULTISPECIES: Sjogren's syndrome/scleroderma autoantigen 1 family protein [Halolamina]|uniref:UPF0148 protein n=1 Tax=Halolamina pelagica TaxID=699431 RepID=A0A1I5QCV5_9EURY|nr:MULTISPECIES: Sjogren's syndrome/scleroderma autoantigen 1 family protein [Halolamina]NHX35198.1 hypothetical protein [Halolamina sp. R1-12]SFP43881.1 UPF0148 protein [Halolamina pelagica]